jgi:release factor glutamine methyltransferase
MTTYAQLIDAAALPRLESRLLLERASTRSRTWLIAHDDEAAPPEVAAEFERLARRRRDGEPIAYLLGQREFHGHAFVVTPQVLIPRPETELLVDWALELIAPGAAAAVLDLGTGSGCIAVALALQRPDLRVTATDRSEAAIEVARGNAQRLGAKTIAFAVGDWFDALPGQRRFDLIVSNPPYIAQADPHLRSGDLRHEPRAALAAGTDGLHALRPIIAASPRRLRSGGWLLLEHGWDQAESVQALMLAAGLRAVATRRDLAGIERATAARAPIDAGPAGR